MYQQNAYLLLFAAALQIGSVVSAWPYLQELSKSNERGMWILGSTLLSIGFLFLSDAFYGLDVHLKPEGALFEIGFGFCMAAGMCMTFLYDALSNRPKKITWLQVSVFALLATVTVGYFDGFLDRLIVKDIFLIFISLWQLKQVNRLRQSEAFVQSRLIFAVALGFLVSSVFFLVIFIEYKLAIRAPEGLIATFLLSMDTQIALASMIYLAVGSHWSAEGAKSTLKYKLDNERIQLLLEEKEVLIQGLMKTHVLVESGALSAGLSHELNQFLAVIQVNSELALQGLQDRERPEHLKPLIENIIKSNQCAANLIASLKRFFTRREESPKPCCFDDLIEENLTLYRDRIKKSNIQLVVDLASREKVILSEALMRQVIANLLINAIEALDLVSRPDKTINIKTARLNGQLHLSISDNGQGIHLSGSEDIFNIFNTTKTHGTGLGLWLSKYIVEKHNGHISHTNIQGESGGVEFKVIIPIPSNEESSGISHER
jgi:signal transduction histidine kinase